MKKTRNTVVFTVVCLLSTLNLSAQLKKDAAKKDAAKPAEKVVMKFDTIKPKAGDLLKNTQQDVKETPKTNEATTKPSADELLESIKRDIKLTTPAENNADEVLPTVEKVVERAPPPPKPPKIIKPLRPYHHELQLEAGAFLNQAFRVFGLVKDGTAYNASPYFLGYKYKFSTKSMEGAAIRLGLGGFFDRKEESPANLKDTKQIDTSAFSGRLGIEFQRNIGDNFRWLFGADGILQSNQKRLFADSGVDQVTDKTIGWTKGFGLMMGIRWDFTDRASIGSEMNIQFLNFQGEQTLKFTANPQFDKVLRKVNNTSTAYLGPANVYISWRF
jgi:hypothetical protein